MQTGRTVLVTVIGPAGRRDLSHTEAANSYMTDLRELRYPALMWRY